MLVGLLGGRYVVAGFCLHDADLRLQFRSLYFGEVLAQLSMRRALLGSSSLGSGACRLKTKLKGVCFAD